MPTIEEILTHDHEVFYCAACRSAFIPNEVKVQSDNLGCFAMCPGVGDEPCREEFGPTRMTADDHMESCVERCNT